MQVLPRSHKIEVVHVVSICCNYVPEYIQDFIQRTVDVGGHPVVDPVFINLKSRKVTDGGGAAACKRLTALFSDFPPQLVLRLPSMPLIKFDVGVVDSHAQSDPVTLKYVSIYTVL